MYLYYDDEPQRRSATAEIWMRCGRRAVTALAVAAVGVAAVYLAPAFYYLLGVLGLL
jgi:hypothetical protein